MVADESVPSESRHSAALFDASWDYHQARHGPCDSPSLPSRPSVDTGSHGMSMETREEGQEVVKKVVEEEEEVCVCVCVHVCMRACVV